MIPLFVNNILVEFSLESFHVDHVYYVARKYCEDNAVSFGVTPDDLENSCTIIVFNNLFVKINERKAATIAHSHRASLQKKADNVDSTITATTSLDSMMTTGNDGTSEAVVASYPVSYHINNSMILFMITDIHSLLIIDYLYNRFKSSCP